VFNPNRTPSCLGDNAAAELENLLSTIASLRLELADVTWDLEQSKQKFHFPSADGFQFRQGANGVYVASKDFTVQKLQACYHLAAKGSGSHASIALTIGEEALPANIKVRVVQGKLHGESGTNIPTLKCEKLYLNVSFTLFLELVQNNGEKGWHVEGDPLFRITSFEKEIYGTGIPIPDWVIDRIVKSFLPSIVQDAIAKNIGGAIPPELGVYLRAAKLPITLGGTLDVEGTEFGVFDTPIGVFAAAAPPSPGGAHPTYEYEVVF